MLLGLAREMKVASLRPLDYAGHGKRMSEPPMVDLNAIADDLLEGLRLEIETEDYGLYGHSMGAHVAALFGLAVQRRGLRTPKVAVLTGTSAPTHRDTSGDYLLPDDAFLSKLRDMGAPAAAAVASQELMQLFLPILRIDFRAVETYAWPEKAMLSFPLVAARGDEDQTVDPAAFEAWRGVTSCEAELHVLPGPHLFPFDGSRGAVAALLDRAAVRFGPR